MHLLFVILNYISVFVMIGCVVLVASHESSKMQKLAMMVCTILLICCVGFLIKSEATDTKELIIGQKLVYGPIHTFAAAVFALYMAAALIVTVAGFDINGLKTANDTIGHNAGDELITGAAKTLNKVFGKYEYIFRTGGDEFFVIIRDKNKSTFYSMPENNRRKQM